jgi:DNA-binding transcriptional MerR regulator
MDDENRENLGKLPGVLAGIRETELPGRKGGVFHYARTVYACFAEIQSLTAEGFTLSTICKFLERKGVLPPEADIRSFCRAYRREKTRRERSVRQKKAKVKEVSVKNDSAAKLMEATGAKREPAMTDKQTPHPVKPKGGLRLNPDNTFKIEPINPDDLPNFENLTKRRKEE